MAIMVSLLIGIRIYIHISFSVYFTFLYIYINDWNLVHTCIMVRSMFAKFQLTSAVIIHIILSDRPNSLAALRILCLARIAATAVQIVASLSLCSFELIFPLTC